MQAIITKFICPTNTRGSRYKAQCERGSLTVDADHALSAEENHRAVCDALCAKFDAEDSAKYGSPLKKSGWTAPKASGQIPSGEYVFCFIPDRFFQRKGTTEI
jgi:hypothetical protein